jgi:enoyl-CoA hydratase
VTVHSERRGREDRVALVTLDRPERRNALDRATLDELHTAIGDAAGARVLVLTGANGHFCSGADLTGVEDESFAVLLQQVLDALHDAPFPTIAAVDGAALGAGTQLAIACDLRVATPGSRFGIPAAKLGLMVNHWTVHRLALLAGSGPAHAMLLAAEVLSGDEAYRLGLANRAGYLGNAVSWAEEIADLAPLTIAGHKVMLNRLEEAPPAGPEITAAFSAAWQSSDLQEGLAAFREHRNPDFEGH